MSEMVRGDIYTEPVPDDDVLDNLGPLRGLAGVWEGARGLDVHPVVTGTEEEYYAERYEAEPIDAQTNGPQLYYGLRYHTHITHVEDGIVKTFHDQIGYWLWEPATGSIIQTLTIPRGQVAMAGGMTTADARSFELKCEFGSPTFGTCSNPTLLAMFQTLEYRITVTVGDDDTWSYEQDTVMRIAGSEQLFHHTDRNTLKRVAKPLPNPAALGD
jgi:hypothetical protein